MIWAITFAFLRIKKENNLDSSGTQQATSLRSNAVGFGGAVIMSAALMGSAVSVYFNPQVTAANAGIATPFVFVLGMVVMLIVANGVMEIARVFPRAGAFYTYVSRGVGPRNGFVTGALMFAAYALLVPAELASLAFMPMTFLPSTALTSTGSSSPLCSCAPWFFSR
jgi:amino acid transporter